MAELTTDDLALLTAEQQEIYTRSISPTSLGYGFTSYRSDTMRLLTALVRARRNLKKYGCHIQDCQKEWNGYQCVCGLIAALGQGTEPG